jgi:putative endonuclease
MPSARQGLGRRGEAAAAAYLRQAGLTIIAQNWRCASGEIDLIARQGTQLVFVEVRTRHTASLNGPSPEESVGPAKARRLVALAYAYLEHAALPVEAPWRIDLIAVELTADGRVARLEQYEYAVGEA